MRASHVIKILEMPTEDLSFDSDYVKLLDLKIDIENACKKLKIEMPMTIGKAKKIVKYLEIE
jgi:hypothetical protein